MNARIHGSVFAAFVFITGCTSTSDNATLDINMERKAAFPSKSETEAEKPIELSSAEKIDWQKFFKPAPTDSQRQILLNKIKAVNSTGLTAPELIKLGHNQVAVGQTMAAEASFREALRQSPHNPSILIDLAELQIKRYSDENAFEYLAQAKQEIENQTDKDHSLLFRYRYVYALALMQAGDFTKAHSVLSDLIMIDKGFTPAYVALADSYLSKNKLELAEFVIRRGIDRAPEIAGLYNVLGQVAKERGNQSAAKENFDKSLALDPGFVPALINLSGLLFEQGDVEIAEIKLKRALAHAPGDVSTYLALGTVQKQMGQSREAKLSLQKALELNPENAGARFELAMLLHDQFKDENSAMRLLSEVVQLGDEHYSPLAQNYLNDIRAQSSDTKF